MTKQALYDPSTGIHRAKIWEIALFAFNNTATNLYMFIFMYIAYFLTGIVGVGVVLAGNITMIMRMWDGVTDPMIGYILDKTNTKFGKNRPFILVGNIILFVGAGAIFSIIPTLPQAFRFIAYVLIYMIYIIGYTCQTVVTKSAQSALTNDPKQRPLFTIFDTIYNTIVFSFFPLIITGYLLPKHGGNEAFTNPALFVDFWLIFGGISAICTLLAVVGIWRKDRVEFFGTGKVQKVTFKDYWDVLKNNRAIQMLVVAASSDKLALSIQGNATVLIMLFGIVVGNYDQYGLSSAVMGTPTTIVTLCAIMFIAVRLGQRKALLYGTYAAMIAGAGIVGIFVFMDPTTLNFDFTSGVTAFTVIYIVLTLIMKAGVGMSGGIVIPMTADCADYEVYRSGRYVPGLMGTLFSFVDKMISSFATAIVSIMLATIGFTEALPTAATPLTNEIFVMTMIFYIGFPFLGWIANLIAMKFYPLTKEKMEEIQGRIAEIKKQAN